MLESDPVIDQILFDCLREREQAYQSYCLCFLLHKSGTPALLFRALRREFDDRTISSHLFSSHLIASH